MYNHVRRMSFTCDIIMYTFGAFSSAWWYINKSPKCRFKMCTRLRWYRILYVPHRRTYLHRQSYLSAKVLHVSVNVCAMYSMYRNCGDTMAGRRSFWLFMILKGSVFKVNVSHNLHGAYSNLTRKTNIMYLN